MQVVQTPHAPVRDEWLQQHVEDILEPGVPIVDAHHHLWDRMGARYLFEDFREDLGSGHNVRASVFVQCRSMYRSEGPVEFRSVGEVEFVNGVAAMAASGIYGPSRACAGIVGFADLTLGASVTPVLEALIRAGGDRFRGVRVPTAWHESATVRSSPVLPPPGLLLDSGFRSGVACLEQFGLSLDVWIYHTQLDDLFELARARPGATIVLDHCGGPVGVGPHAGKRHEVFAAWKTSLSRLASLPNVHVKLGGLGMPVSGFTFHQRPNPPSSIELAEAWRPYIATCIELFGPSRCMFESNFPVDKGMFSYPVMWNAFKRLAASCSETEKAEMFSGTAGRVYKLQPIDGEAPS